MERLYYWLIEEILREDIGHGDVTTEAIVDSHIRGRAEIIAKDDLVLSGIDVALEVFKYIDSSVEIERYFENGDEVLKGSVICKIIGTVRGLLGAERVAINLLQHLSGIATMTRAFVKKIEEALKERGGQGGCYLLDTRKTTPLLRKFEKQAVLHGGGRNHRFGLFDGVLIKENHIVAAGGSIKEAIRRVKNSVHHLLKIEVEVESISQLLEAVEAGVDMVLLDNFELEELKKAIRICKEKGVLCEVSGGVNLSNIKEFVWAGADFISSGAITHSAPAVDISMKLREIFN